MQTEAILDTWRSWDAHLSVRPRVVHTLSGGRSNRSFLLNSYGQKMVLRINASQVALPDPDRANEARIWQAASKAGIAPKLVYADPKGAYLVSIFVENDLPDRPQDDPALKHKALELLQRCHDLQVEAPEIDYRTHIDRYWQLIEYQGSSVSPELRQQHEQMLLLLEEIANSSSDEGLCHHDPVVENFVGSPEELYLIDWEYAAHGLPVMDYAALAVEWGIDDAIMVRQTGVNLDLLSIAKDFYRYECSLWEAITGKRRSWCDEVV